jgi:hypothetical protein
MIASDLAASARRDEPTWWAHWGEKQRGARRQGHASAVPADNRPRCSSSAKESPLQPSPDWNFEANAGDLMECPG